MDKDQVPFVGPKPHDYIWNPISSRQYDARCAACIRYWSNRDVKIRPSLTRPLGRFSKPKPWERW